MRPTHSANLVSTMRLESIWLFIVCWIAVAAILIVLGTPPVGPTVFPDEVCRLGWARLLSGAGSHYDMSQAAYCQPYYALLLAPFQWLSQEPTATYRAVFAINSVLAAACLPLTVRLGIRHFGLNTVSAWFAGVAILAYPSLTLYSHHALPETALFPAILLTFGLWCNWVDQPDWQRLWKLLAMSILLYALHRKMLVVPLAVMGGVIVGYWFNRTPEFRMKALLTALALAVAFMLDELAKRAVFSYYFLAGDAGAIDVLGSLTTWESVLIAGGKAAGVLVYSTIVTGGLIWLVLGNGLEAIRRGIRDGFSTLDPFVKKSMFAVGMFILLATVTATYMRGSARFDLWFYGRHVDSTLGIVLLTAIVMIAKGRIDGAALRWTIALSTLALLTLIVVLPGPPWRDFSAIHVIGAGPVLEWMYQADERWILLLYCAAILSLAGAMLLARLPGLFRFAALAPFAILATTIHLAAQPFKGVPIEQAISESAANILREAEPCKVHFDRRAGGRLRLHQYFRLQYYFPNCSIEVVPYDYSIPPGGLVIVNRILADCEIDNEVKCHDLHPDLVLFQVAEK